MKYLLAVHLVIFSSTLFADEESSSESSLLYFELGKISASLSFYTENWDPQEKLPLKLPGIQVEEKDLVVGLDESIKKSREEQDLLRSQNSWLSDSNPWVSPIETREECCEEIQD